MVMYEMLDRPNLAAPPLIVALEGWIDAGLSANHALDVVLEQLEPTVVARFDPDELLDYRARRPTMHLAEGINTGLTWASTELLAAKDEKGNDLLILMGAEPDRAWRRFCREVRDLTVELGCRMMIGLGAYPAGTPHTRPPLLSMTASTEELAATLGYQRGTLEVPAGMEAALERTFADAGIPAVGLWAQVPHYVSAMRYPAASAALIEGLNAAAGLSLGVGALGAEAMRIRDRIDALIEANPEHVQMLHQLEAQYDQQAAEARPPAVDFGETDLPSVDELAAEVERFLREQD
jgi:predicted ATP-grasp superfamily ATP-dependent carboligase